MRILFVAKHDSGDNDDEGAVAHALRVLGHEVTCLQEQRRKRDRELASCEADFCLFFKWPTVSEIVETSKRMPCAFWFFDMVRSIDNDPTLHARSLARIQWMADVIPYVIAGFCTDGDWVKHIDVVLPGRLVHLMQGADERTACVPPHNFQGPPILFTGMVNHGQKRAEHISELHARYGDRFEVLGNRGPRGRIHGRALAERFAQARVVVAPDGPSTDLYWSNRVYLTTGLGGYLIHPFCAGLADQYRCGVISTLPMYVDRAECVELIEDSLRISDRLWDSWRHRTHEWTMKHHTYRHRCEELIRVVKERM